METTTIIFISWFVIFFFLFFWKTIFPKKWTFKEAREKVKFSKTMWLNNYADAKGWDKTYQRKSWWMNIKEKLKAYVST